MPYSEPTADEVGSSYHPHCVEPPKSCALRLMTENSIMVHYKMIYQADGQKEVLMIELLNWSLATKFPTAPQPLKSAHNEKNSQ